jgi:hypothetical protein
VITDRRYCSVLNLRTVALITVAIWVLGCGGPLVKPVQLVLVSGSVKLDEKPLPRAIVVFEAADASFSYAMTDQQGRYDLQFDSRTRGATLGPKTVRISMNRRIHGLNSNDEGGPDDQAGGSFKKQQPELIPDKYNSRSTLTREVTLEARTFNFDLRSEKRR